MKFETKQKTNVIEYDDKYHIFIYLNEKKVTETFDGVEKTTFDYDYHEILTDSLYLKNQILANPQDYLNYKDTPKSDEEKIIELQARVDYLEMMVG